MNKLNTYDKMFYLIGSNISSSLSPVIHNTLFSMKHMNKYRYELYKEDKLPTLQQLKNDVNFGGMSITIPFKRSYYEQYIQNNQYSSKLKHSMETYQPQHTNQQKMLLSYKDPFSQKSKICNTLIKINNSNNNNNNNNQYSDNNIININNNKIFFQAYNTDLYGIQRTLKNAKIQGNCLIIGSGATAQTFVEYFYQQGQEKCDKIYVCNRSRDKVEKLCEKYRKVQIVEIGSKQEIVKVGFVVNSLPSQVLVENYEKYLQLFHKIQFNQYINIMDVNYRCKDKLLQKLVIKVNNNIKMTDFSGLDMLVWQAIKQNQIFCQQKQTQQEVNNQYYCKIKQILKERGFYQ